MATNTERKSTVNVKQLVVFPMTLDNETTITYGTATPIAKVLMAATDAPSVATGTQEAEGQTVESYSAVTGGKLDIDLTALNSADRVLFYGETIKNGTNVTNKDDFSEYVMVAYMTVRGDGLVNLKKFPKIRFSPQSETDNQMEKNGIKYSTSKLSGEYLPTINDGDAKYVRYGVDPVVDAAIITSWFTDASYYKPIV